jgi:RNA polymerase sigma-70 factor (ECF subfamily)
MSYSEAQKQDAVEHLRQAVSRRMARAGDPDARTGQSTHTPQPDAGITSSRPNPQGAARDAAVAANAFMPEDADRNLDFDALVDKYQKKIFNVIYRKIGDFEEATDLTQETFINAFKHYDRFRGDAKVFTWLYTIATNLCINRMRQRERQRGMRIESLDQPRDSDEDEGLTREVADFTHAPHNLLEDKELRQRILAAVDSLPPDYKEVVLLREFHDMSYNEIVTATGLSLENVKTRLSRARGMLRRKLEPYVKM